MSFYRVQGMKKLDNMTPCECGHPLWCHATYVRNPEFDELETTPKVKPYLLGEPGECDHIGSTGWDCDCKLFEILSTFSVESDASEEVMQSWE